MDDRGFLTNLVVPWDLFGYELGNIWLRILTEYAQGAFLMFHSFVKLPLNFMQVIFQAPS